MEENDRVLDLIENINTAHVSVVVLPVSSSVNQLKSEFLVELERGLGFVHQIRVKVLDIVALNHLFDRFHVQMHFVDQAFGNEYSGLLKEILIIQKLKIKYYYNCSLMYNIMILYIVF